MMNDFQTLGNKVSCFGVKASNQSWQELFIINIQRARLSNHYLSAEFWFVNLAKCKRRIIFYSNRHNLDSRNHKAIGLISDFCEYIPRLAALCLANGYLYFGTQILFGCAWRRDDFVPPVCIVLQQRIRGAEQILFSNDNDLKHFDSYNFNFRNDFDITKSFARKEQ